MWIFLTKVSAFEKSSIRNNQHKTEVSLKLISAKIKKSLKVFSPTSSKHAKYTYVLINNH